MRSGYSQTRSTSVAGCSERPDFSPAQPRRAKTRLVPSKAAAPRLTLVSRLTFHGSWERGENAAGGLCQQPAKGVYPAATMERGIARLAASTNEVRFGGPCRGRTYGPLIKSSDPPQSEPTQGELSAGKTEESEKSSS